MPSWNSNTANGYSLTLTLSVVSQNIANNTSTVSWNLKVNNPRNQYFIARINGNLTVGGVLLWNVPDSTFNSSPSNSSKTLASGSTTYTHATNGQLGITFAANLRTHTQGQAWSVPQLSLSGLFSIPPIVRLPGRPNPPTVSENDSTRQVTVTVPVPSSPSPITGYQVRMLNNDTFEWITRGTNASRQYIFTPAKPLLSYNFQGRALTEAGPGEWSTSTSVALTGSGPYVRYNNEYRKTNAYMKVDGEWIPVLCQVRDSTTYRTVGR